MNHATGIQNRFGQTASHLFTPVFFFYLRVQRTSDGHLPLFGKHIGHEKVANRGDYAVQTIFLTGKVNLRKIQIKNAFFTRYFYMESGFLMCDSVRT